MAERTSREKAERDDDRPRDVDELEELREERDRYLASWQRAQADYQNLKRRTLADIEREKKQAKRALLEDMLLVLDHLEMALIQRCETDEGKQVLLGVELTRDQMLSLLEREDVHALPAEGTFDPNIHEAVSTVAGTEIPPGEIVEVMRRGYRWGDDVLRPARVIVAAEPMKRETNPGAGRTPEAD